MGNLQLRYTFRDKIYNYKPPWILKWGITAVILHIIVIIILTGFIDYPDSITGAVTISSQNPPLTVKAQINSKIKKIFIKDGQYVKKGERLMLLETTVVMSDLECIEKQIDKVINEISNSDNIKPVLEHEYLNLGELQSYYSEFKTEYFSYCQYFESNSIESQIVLKRKLLKEYEVQRKCLLSNKDIYMKDYDLATRQFRRDSILFEIKAYTSDEFDNAQRSYIKTKYQLSELNSNLSSINISIEKVKYEIDELESTRNEKINLLKNNLIQSIDLLKSRISLWKQNYLLTAPIDGKVVFLTYWSEQQNVLAGDIVLSIELDMKESKVRVTFPPSNAGKVEIGQVVKIKLDNYSYNEYGGLSGKISYISQIPLNNNFIADVVLDDGMKTSYGIDLPLGAYTGKAAILVKKRKLLFKILDPLKGLLNPKDNK